MWINYIFHNKEKSVKFLEMYFLYLYVFHILFTFIPFSRKCFNVMLLKMSCGVTKLKSNLHILIILIS